MWTCQVRNNEKGFKEERKFISEERARRWVMETDRRHGPLMWKIWKT